MPVCTKCIDAINAPEHDKDRRCIYVGVVAGSNASFMMIH